MVTAFRKTVLAGPLIAIALITTAVISGAGMALFERPHDPDRRIGGVLHTEYDLHGRGIVLREKTGQRLDEARLVEVKRL